MALLALIGSPAGVVGTPSFTLARPGEDGQPLDLNENTAEELGAAVDAALVRP